jgi:hypothetical protein
MKDQKLTEWYNPEQTLRKLVHIREKPLCKGRRCFITRGGMGGALVTDGIVRICAHKGETGGLLTINPSPGAA